MAAATSSKIRVEFKPVALLDRAEWDALYAISSAWVVESREDFEAAGRPHHEVIRFRQGTTLVGFGFLSTHALRHEGKTRVMLFTTDVYIDPTHQGQSLIQRSGLMSYLRAKRRFPLAPIYWLFEAASPVAYMLLTRNFKDYWPHHDRPLLPGQHELRMTAIQAVFGPDHANEHGIVTNPTRILVWKSDAAFRTGKELDPAYAYYEAINPGWPDGEGVVCVCPLTMGNFVAMAMNAGRRMTRVRARTSARSALADSRATD